MELAELKRMNSEDLWTLHLKIYEVLQQKIQQAKLQLEEHLRRF